MELFSSRRSARPPPYSEIEHISVQDQSYVLYLANVDTSNKRSGHNSPRDSDVNHSILIDDNEVCQSLSCKKVVLEIVQSLRRIKDERAELNMELEAVETEATELETQNRLMEEESERYDSDTAVYEKQKREGEEKLATSAQKKGMVKRTNLELQSKLVAAENNIANHRNELNDLGKIVKSLMWKGERLSKAYHEGKTLPDMCIKVVSENELSKADDMYKTSYYALVSSSTLDSSERTVMTIKSDTARTHHRIPRGVPISSKRNTKSTMDATDDTSTIATNQSQLVSLDKDAAFSVINSKTYRNSVSSVEVKPFPSFTQPNRWGKSAKKLQPIDASLRMQLFYSTIYNEVLKANNSGAKASRRRKPAMKDTGSSFGRTEANNSSSNEAESASIKSTENFAGKKMLSVDKMVTYSEIGIKERKFSEEKIEAGQLLDPIFYEEKARMAWRRNVSVGDLRAPRRIQSNYGQVKLDDVSDDDNSVGCTVATSISPINQSLTGSLARVGKPKADNDSKFDLNHRWKVSGKKVTYPGRTPSR